jgi:CST complex subunit TEN1
MASSGLKPGVPVILRELEPSSEMFKQGASLRVTGKYVLEPPYNIVPNI